MTLTLEVPTWFLCRTHCLMWLTCDQIISKSINKRQVKGPKKKKTLFLTSDPSVTLTLDVRNWFLCMTHHLIVVNISAKLPEIHQGMAKLLVRHNKMTFDTQKAQHQKVSPYQYIGSYNYRSFLL